jgi:phosphoribosyl-ATP pyrophosphohydrolase
MTDEAFSTCKDRIEALKNTGATVTYYDDDDREIDQLTVEEAAEILNTAVDVSDDEIATLMKLVSHVIKDFQLEGILDMLEDSLDG